MDVLLVRPPEPQMSRFYSKGESLGLGYLAAVLRHDGLNVEILDCVLLDWDHERAVAEIGRRDFAVLGFSVFAVALPMAVELAQALRDQGCEAHFTMGGHFPSFRAKQALLGSPQFDSVVTFEGELTLAQLALAIKEKRDWSGTQGLAFRDRRGVWVNPPREPILDLDSLPFPARDMLPHALQWERDAYISTSRGCWGQCTYCSISPFYRQAGVPAWRARSPGNVVDELAYLVRTFDPWAIGVVDADFIGPGAKGRRRALAIADDILRRRLEVRLGVYTRVDEVEEKLFEKLNAAGLSTVYLGVESGVQAALNRWRKNTTVEDNYRALGICARLGIRVEAGFMLYDPYTTMDEVRQNLRFLEDTQAFDFPSLLARMEVRAGMPMEDQLRREGRLRGDYRASEYEMADPRAEVFHAGLCQVLEPLALVYLSFRDLKRTPGVSHSTVAIAQDRLNRKALRLARRLADALTETDVGGVHAVADAVAQLQRQAAREADRLRRVASFLDGQRPSVQESVQQTRRQLPDQCEPALGEQDV